MPVEYYSNKRYKIRLLRSSHLRQSDKSRTESVIVGAVNSTHAKQKKMKRKPCSNLRKTTENSPKQSTIVPMNALKISSHKETLRKFSEMKYFFAK